MDIKCDAPIPFPPKETALLPLSVIEAGRDAMISTLLLNKADKTTADVEALAEAAYRAMQAADPDCVEMREALAELANWRKNSAAYTDSMNLPRRKMDEAQVIHMESVARAALARTANETGSET